MTLLTSTVSQSSTWTDPLSNCDGKDTINPLRSKVSQTSPWTDQPANGDLKDEINPLKSKVSQSDPWHCGEMTLCSVGSASLIQPAITLCSVVRWHHGIPLSTTSKGRGEEPRSPYIEPGGIRAHHPE